MKIISQIILIVFIGYSVQAQKTKKCICQDPEEPLTHGLFLQWGASTLSQLPEQTNYSASGLNSITQNNRPLYDIGGGIFLEYRFKQAPMGVLAEIGFKPYGGFVDYQDTQNQSYQLWYQYHNLTLGYVLKGYLGKRWSLGVGPQMGFNVSNRSIRYQSQNINSSLSDKDIENRLRNIYRPNVMVALQGGIGYQLDHRMSVEVRYLYGLTDDITTQINAFDNNLKDPENQSQALSIGLYYRIP
jgi:hypothetical protein